MNPHSKIEREPTRSLKMRLRSRAFRRGLGDGFGATTLFLMPREYRLASDVDVSIEGTWKAVGEAVRTAQKIRGADLGETTREAQPPSKLPAPATDTDPVAEEIAKRISAIVPPQQRAQVIAQMTSLVVEERFSGPIPHPRHFREYEECLPGSGRELMDMARSNLEHNQNVQSRALQADIEDMKEGRRLGFVALVILMIGAIICGLMDKDAIAFALLGATVIGTITQLIKGRGKNGE